jgi:adenylate cyclase
MPLEIERKISGYRRRMAKGQSAGDAFLPGLPRAATVRVRRAGNRACVTIKGRRRGIARAEFEYLIPVKDAEELLTLCSKPLIDKTRYSVGHRNHVWAVDVFEGANTGLVLAEIELRDPEEPFERHRCGNAPLGMRPSILCANIPAPLSPRRAPAAR